MGKEHIESWPDMVSISLHRVPESRVEGVLQLKVFYSAPKWINSRQTEQKVKAN